MSAVDFLGLAKKAGRLESGEESVGIAARAGKAKVILTASDAGRSTLVRAENAARAAKCPVVPVPATREELGALLGREVVGIAAVTDIGFASAFIDKLSAETEGLEEVRAALDAQNERAMERRRELRRHEQKLKRGKKAK